MLLAAGPTLCVPARCAAPFCGRGSQQQAIHARPPGKSTSASNQSGFGICAMTCPKTTCVVDQVSHHYLGSRPLLQQHYEVEAIGSDLGDCRPLTLGMLDPGIEHFTGIISAARHMSLQHTQQADTRRHAMLQDSILRCSAAATSSFLLDTSSQQWQCWQGLNDRAAGDIRPKLLC